MDASLEQSDKQAWTMASLIRAKKLPTFESLSRKKKIARNGLELKNALQATAMKESKR